MLRSRKLSSACIALGAASLMVTTSVPLAYGHGFTNAPTSRAKFCQQGTVSNCGQIQWEPQSVEGPKGFPGAGPADGKLCSAGLGQFAQLDDPRGGAWPTTSVRSGQSYTFRWHLTAPHRTTNFKYYITKQGWNSNAPLTRSALDLTPFLTVNLNGAQPSTDPQHPGTIPSRSGRHLILAVWTIHDTANAFYQCSDVNFG
ncbi:lytic polysaccharide monooxygenase [Kribbella sp. NBC_01245]|uniref:lytic polysaccharide monooxygenase auxiliary activity family 9 protein n=1 Tax=Kribbella sp. NBC_01245 TaxID=2903578 RepID=UPI002E2DA475|nr:lytic polysaccharide monooxygenase [Kribbella sp. NBC_01245]